MAKVKFDFKFSFLSNDLKFQLFISLIKTPRTQATGSLHMASTQYVSKDWRLFSVFVAFFISSFFLIQAPKAFAGDICVDGLEELQRSQEVIQNKGGIWGYLEQSSILKDKSILGLQIDGKLQRLTVSFESLCGKGKTPTPKLYNLILNLIGDARIIFNRAADQQDKNKVLERLNDLNKNIDELLVQLHS